jgi:ABC-type polysaccharide/polyol phosphate transport system ATPase subunit
MAASIEVDGLGKRYRLGTDPASYDTLRDALRRAVRRRREPRSHVWALRDLEFHVEVGEAVGIIGPNGAGKTTLLKLLAGVTEPSEGEARVRGNVGALLAVGTGFHPELTGSENIYLGGAILGMRRSDVRDRYDEIVEFAGVERFLDTPVKRYSEGMRLRLAFAVAAFIEPPILVVDEVLSVGDAAFRERCLGKMSNIGREGRTVLYVSHDLGSVTRLCSRAIWLDHGSIRADGPASEVVTQYLDAGREPVAAVELTDDGTAPAAFTAARVARSQFSSRAGHLRDEPVDLVLRLVVREPVLGLDAGIWLEDEAGLRIIDDVCSDSNPSGGLPSDPGTYEVTITIPPMLRAQNYQVGAWLGTDLDTFSELELLAIPIAARPEDRRDSIERRRAVQPPVSWAVASAADR